MVASLELERYLADVVRDPMTHLKPGERQLLRKLVETGCAIKAKGGWMCKGTWYRDAAFRRFLQLDLADQTYFDGHRLRPNYRAKGIIAQLNELRQKKAG